MHSTSAHAPPGFGPVRQRPATDPGCTAADAAADLAHCQDALAAVRTALTETSAQLDQIAAALPASGADQDRFVQAFGRKAALADLADRLAREVKTATETVANVRAWEKHVAAEAERRVKAAAATEEWNRADNANALAFRLIAELQAKDRSKHHGILRRDIFSIVAVRTFGRAFLREGADATEANVVVTDRDALAAFVSKHWQALASQGGELRLANQLHAPAQRTSIIA